MPTPPLEEPTSKVTLNLFTRDIDDLKKIEGQWTTKVREIVHAYMEKQRGSKR